MFDTAYGVSFLLLFHYQAVNKAVNFDTELSEIAKSNENLETLTKKMNEFGERVSRAQISSYVKVFIKFLNAFSYFYIFIVKQGFVQRFC